MGNMIEVGEYVRTETGFIRRIKSVDKTEATEKCPVNMYWCNLDKPIKILKECSKDTIYAIEMSDAKKLKHSNNILDLIEPGDLVRIFVEENVDENGTTEDTCVYEVTTTQVKDFYGNKLEEIGIVGEDGTELIPSANVRGIVTKEQFASEEYKVEEQIRYE